MHFVQTPLEFRETVLQELGFLPTVHDYYTLYQNPEKPENGHYMLYERQGYYDFGIADYSIDHPFSIQFDNKDSLIRFGTVFEGTTKFQLENQPISSFSPSSFFVVERGIKGKQIWKRGQHFHGAEISIQKRYLEEIVSPLFPFDLMSPFLENYTYHYLPLDMQAVLHRLTTLSEQGQLNPIHLESAILQCIAILAETIFHPTDNSFINQVSYERIKLGENRFLTLTPHDIRSIQKAHDILVSQIVSPPTIEMLSEELLINAQKLQVGFIHYYHMSIGEFSTSLKMSMASTLLCTTDKSIAEIAEEVGYLYPSNFIKKFKQTYSCTPLKYRQREKARKAPL